MKKPNIKGMSATQAHATMEIWAKQFTGQNLVIRLEFEDGSHFEDIVGTPSGKAVQYKVDGETYTVDIDTAKFDVHFLDLWGVTRKTAREAYLAWVRRQPGLSNAVLIKKEQV